MKPSDFIMQTLVKSGTIPKNFTGQVIFDIGQGHLFEVRKFEGEKLLLNRLDSIGENFSLDFSRNSAILFSNNTM